MAVKQEICNVYINNKADKYVHFVNIQYRVNSLECICSSAFA